MIAGDERGKNSCPVISTLRLDLCDKAPDATSHKAPCWCRWFWARQLQHYEQLWTPKRNFEGFGLVVRADWSLVNWKLGPAVATAVYIKDGVYCRYPRTVGSTTRSNMASRTWTIRESILAPGRTESWRNLASVIGGSLYRRGCQL